MKLTLNIAKRITAIILLSAAALIANGQDLLEIDGQSYKTAKIGTKVWTVENLNVLQFRNGDTIPQAKTAEEWKAAALAGTPAWCYYENSDSIGKLKGKLYNWYALNDPRGLVPAGWRIPTNADWTKMTKYLGGVDIAGIKMKTAVGWKSNPGNNISRFSGLPGGTRDENGVFNDIERVGRWWSLSGAVGNPQKAYNLRLTSSFVEVFYEMTDKGYGFSVRAVKD